jgi:cell division transport system permease protein
MMARRVDHLGLRSAMAERLTPILVGAMSFLAVLAIAGALSASSLAGRWSQDSGTALTVQVPDPDAAAPAGGTTRLRAVLDLLGVAPDVSAVRTLSGAEVNALLRPWLGGDAGQLALPVPAVIIAVWSGGGEPDLLRAALDAAAPGTLAETGARWAARVAALTGSLQASALSVLVIVAFVAAAVISVATHAGLAQRRETISIVHGLGALDSDIAGRFAVRATVLAGAGASIGTACALPVLFWLAALAAPFAGVLPAQNATQLPFALWLALPAVPVAAAVIGWLTSQVTVRGWLRRMV